MALRACASEPFKSIHMNNRNKKSRIDDQLAAARFVLASGRKSPREIGIQLRLETFEWIYRCGFTTSSVGQMLVNKTSGGYLKKLADQGWLRATKTESGSPLAFFTLAEKGLQEAERHSYALYRYAEIDPYKVNQQTIRHNLIAQYSTLKALQSGHIVDYKTERMLTKQGDKLGVKRPDVMWITESGTRLGVEVELSAKWDRNLDDFILKIFRALKQREDESSDYDRFIIISDSAAIINRYKKAFQPNEPVSSWIKNDRAHWVIEKEYKVPTWLIDKIDFQLIESKS